jgi:hypothetical protein
MQPLHKLPNGTWIDLANVREISPYNAIGHDTAYCAITCGSVFYSLPFASLSDAKAYADSLAGLVNEVPRTTHHTTGGATTGG